MSTTTIGLPEDLKERVANAAGRAGKTTHSFIAHIPLIGRPIAGGKGELIIGRKAHGYLAQYRYVDQIDTVFVLAIIDASRSASGVK